MVLGLTGGIGSGKTTVAKLFELLGGIIFDSDLIAKEIYFEHSVKLQIIDLLGAESYISDFKINKSFISSKIFSNTDLLHKLNNIIHPPVIDKFKLFKKQNPNQLIIKETALLFETHLENEVDKTVMVASDVEKRIARIIKRDGLSREDILKKIKSQLPQEDKIKKADFVIYNNEEQFLMPQVLIIYNKILKK